MRWGMIDEEVAREYFSNNHRILISSNQGRLSGFKERFPWLDVTEFDDSMLDDYLSGKFDLLISEMSGIWPRTMTRRLSSGQVFLDMFNETVRRWFNRNGIEYYVVPNKCEVDLSHRWRFSKFLLGRLSNNIISDGHYIAADADTPDVHIINGIRQTKDVPVDYEHTIYVIGPCIAFGHTVADGETLASNLQKLLNDNNLPYRVVNIGLRVSLEYATELDINALYRIFHMPLHKGDIVLSFTLISWLGSSPFYLPAAQQIDLQNAFRSWEKENRYCFYQSGIFHLNKKGNDIAAKYIFKKIMPGLKSKLSCRETGRIQPFPYITNADSNDNMPRELADYIDKIKQAVPHAASGERRGAVVMNVNPFTLGHYHLVEKASSMVDFLYVFIVEEDKSAFSFHDRIMLAQENCKLLKNCIYRPKETAIPATWKP